MNTKLPFADEDGNILPALDPSSGVAQIITLLEYGRKRGFRIGPTVQVGDVIVQVKDLKQEEAYAIRNLPNDGSIWDDAGFDGEDKP
jgi:hypothetical protein